MSSGCTGSPPSVRTPRPGEPRPWPVRVTTCPGVARGGVILWSVGDPPEGGDWFQFRSISDQQKTAPIWLGPKTSPGERRSAATHWEPREAYRVEKIQARPGEVSGLATSAGRAVVPPGRVSVMFWRWTEPWKGEATRFQPAYSRVVRTRFSAGGPENSTRPGRSQ